MRLCLRLIDRSRTLAYVLRYTSIMSPPSPPIRPPQKRPPPPSPEANPKLDAPVSTLFVPPEQKPKPQTKKRKHGKRRPLPEPYSPGDVLWRDVQDFLGDEYIAGVLAEGEEWTWPKELEFGAEVTVRVGAFTVSGARNEMGGTKKLMR